MHARWLCPALLAAACGSSPRDENTRALDDAAAPMHAPQADVEVPAAPTLVPSRLPEDFRCEPTLSSIKTTIFEVSCHFDACHGNNDAAWGLRLGEVSDEAALASMLRVPAGTCPNWLILDPGNPEGSLLLEKVANPDPECGGPMPRGFELLPPSAVACIAEWIASLDP
jgi:hypothetical protein